MRAESTPEGLSDDAFSTQLSARNGLHIPKPRLKPRVFKSDAFIIFVNIRIFQTRTQPIVCEF